MKREVCDDCGFYSDDNDGDGAYCGLSREVLPWYRSDACEFFIRRADTCAYDGDAVREEWEAAGCPMLRDKVSAKLRGG